MSALSVFQTQWERARSKMPAWRGPRRNVIIARARAAALFSEVKNSFGKKRPCSDWLDCAYSATRRSGTWSSFLLQITLIIGSPPVLSANLRYAIERAPLYASSLLQLCRVSSALTFRYGACARARSGARRNFERTDGSLCNTFLKRELPSGVE